MSLPKVTYPIIEITQPSTKKKLKARRFTVKEEKILLIAKVAKSNLDIYKAVKQVVNNCILEDDFEIDEIPIFDLEYIFIRLRIASVSNISTVSYFDPTDEETRDFDIDLEDIEVTWPNPIPNPVIKVNDEIGFKLKWPAASMYENDVDVESISYEEIVARCIDSIYDGDNIYKAKDFKINEIVEFIESLSIDDYDKVKEFYKNAPHLHYEIKYKNKVGMDRSIELKSLTDFFIF